MYLQILKNLSCKYLQKYSLPNSTVFSCQVEQLFLCLYLVVCLHCLYWRVTSSSNIISIYSREHITPHLSIRQIKWKKCLADFLFWFLFLRLWEDVLKLQKQAKLKDNIIFSAQGALKKKFGDIFLYKIEK